MSEIFRLFALGVITLLLAFPLAALTPQEAVDRAVDSRAIKGESSAIMITELATGKRLAGHNTSLPLIPASIMKSISTASLLSSVGHEYIYETPVFAEGKIRDGVLEGNLVVVGQCDPSLNSKYINDIPSIVDEIVEALQKKDVTEIQGRILIDESRFAGPAINPYWNSGDLGASYGTGTHPFNYDDNAQGKSSVKDPSEVFRRHLRSAFAKAGITLREEEVENPGRRQKLLTHRSAPVDEIMRSCMMRSDNQYAEAILRTFGKSVGEDGSTQAAARREMEKWERSGAPMEGVTIVDGSGLSRKNRLTAEFMTHVLGKMASDPWYASFFPLAGQEGTLKKFLADTPLEGYVAMKTGSMSGIQCYAGYLLDDDYVPTHVIVVMLNDMTDRAAARAQLSRMLLNIFAPSPAPEPLEEE